MKLNKLEAYRRGKYLFAPAYLPSSAHTLWTELDWINFIDHYGRWPMEIDQC